MHLAQRLLASIAVPLAPLSTAHAAPLSGLGDELVRAGGNRTELERALAECPKEQLASMEWLVEHMPEADLATLDAKFLLAHVDGAHTAWRSAPWSARVDEQTFRDAILPYCSVSEKRELWLPALRARCMPFVEGLSDPALAAARLNQRMFPEFKVAYSTKRRRADQSPSESMESGLASCTGLSVLLVDACRSVGIPARFVGVPLWTDGSGNHSWVEVWDGAAWRYTGAAEPTGDALDQGWFSGRASAQNRDKPEYAIYAVTWRDSGVEFPMVFDPSRPRARAVDVTDRYAGKSPEIPAGMTLLRISVRDARSNLRLAREVEVRDTAQRDEVVATGRTKDERFDLNDHLELVVPQGGLLSFAVDGTPIAELREVRRDGKVVETILTAPETKATSAAPGAVSGRFAAIRAEGDIDLAIDADIMPVELVSPEASIANGWLAAAWRDAAQGEGAAQDGPRRPRTPLDELRAFLKNGSGADVAAQGFATTRIGSADVARVVATLDRANDSAIRAADKKDFDARVLSADGVQMPFWYAVYGDKPKDGRSLFISMHGGGGAPKQVNDQQWENQKKLYQPAEGVYVAPRAPTDTWNLWHQGHIDALFAKLIRDMVVFEGVNPNRVYFMGYSAGGDGVYQLAPRMADFLAAAAMMAGHPNETRPDGLRNLPFTLHMGGDDKAFNHNDIARSWKTTLAELAAKDPGGYPHEVVIHEGKGHWMQREDAVAVPWMAKFTRDLRPAKIVWLQDDVTSPRFYWLANPAPKQGQRVVATRDGQTVTIEEASGVDELVVRLDDSMCRLDDRVVIRTGEALGSRVLFEGVPTRSIATIARTLAERGDPTGVFSAEIAVRVAPAPVADTGAEQPASR